MAESWANGEAFCLRVELVVVSPTAEKWEWLTFVGGSVEEPSRRRGHTLGGRRRFAPTLVHWFETDFL